MVYVPPIAFWGFDDANMRETYGGGAGNGNGRFSGRSRQASGFTSSNPHYITVGPMLDLDVTSGILGFAILHSTVSPKTSTTYPLLEVHFNSGESLSIYYSGGRVSFRRGATTLVTSGFVQDYLPDAGEWYYVEFRWVRHPSAGHLEVRINGYSLLSFSGNTGSSDSTLREWTVNSLLAQSSQVNLDDAYLVNDPVGDADWLGDLRVVQQYPAGPGSSTEWTPTPAGTPNWETVNEVATSTTDYISAAEGDLTDLYTPTPISGPWRIHGVKIETPARKNISGNAPDVRALNVLGAAEAEYPVQPPGNASWANRGATVQPLAPDGGEWTVAKLNATEFGVRSVAQ